MGFENIPQAVIKVTTRSSAALMSPLHPTRGENPSASCRNEFTFLNKNTVNSNQTKKKQTAKPKKETRNPRAHQNYRILTRSMITPKFIVPSVRMFLLVPVILCLVSGSTAEDNPEMLRLLREIIQQAQPKHNRPGHRRLTPDTSRTEQYKEVHEIVQPERPDKKTCDMLKRAENLKELGPYEYYITFVDGKKFLNIRMPLAVPNREEGEDTPKRQCPRKKTK